MAAGAALREWDWEFKVGEVASRFKSIREEGQKDGVRLLGSQWRYAVEAIDRLNEAWARRPPAVDASAREAILQWFVVFDETDDRVALLRKASVVLDPRIMASLVAGMSKSYSDGVTSRTSSAYRRYAAAVDRKELTDTATRVICDVYGATIRLPPSQALLYLHRKKTKNPHATLEYADYADLSKITPDAYREISSAFWERRHRATAMSVFRAIAEAVGDHAAVARVRTIALAAVPSREPYPGVHPAQLMRPLLTPVRKLVRVENSSGANSANINRQSRRRGGDGDDSGYYDGHEPNEDDIAFGADVYDIAGEGGDGFETFKTFETIGGSSKQSSDLQPLNISMKARPGDNIQPYRYEMERLSDPAVAASYGPIIKVRSGLSYPVVDRLRVVRQVGGDNAVDNNITERDVSAALAKYASAHPDSPATLVNDCDILSESFVYGGEFATGAPRAVAYAELCARVILDALPPPAAKKPEPDPVPDIREQIRRELMAEFTRDWKVIERARAEMAAEGVSSDGASFDPAAEARRLLLSNETVPGNSYVARALDGLMRDQARAEVAKQVGRFTQRSDAAPQMQQGEEPVILDPSKMFGRSVYMRNLLAVIEKEQVVLRAIREAVKVSPFTLDDRDVLRAARTVFSKIILE